MDGRQRKGAGIALIAVLLLLSVMTVLGVSAAVLTRVGYNISSNVATNTVAKANATAGLDAAIAYLEKEFLATGVFPGSIAGFPAAIVGAGGYTPQYVVLDNSEHAYVVAGDLARVAVRGSGPRGAEHVSEAVVMMVPGEPVETEDEYGLKSEARCFTTGRSDFLDAGIHCNGGFNLGNDTYRVCEERSQVDGTCIAWEEVPVSSAPVSASDGATECSPRELCVCERGKCVPKNLNPTVTVDPAYAERVNAALDAVNHPAGCTVTWSTVSEANWTAVGNGDVVCVADVANLVLPTSLNGVTVITRGSLLYGSGTRVEDSTLISLEGQITQTTGLGMDIHIISSNLYSLTGITLNGQQTVIEGVSTIASGGSITLNGQAPGTTFTDDNGVSQFGVGLKIYAEGAVTINGGSDWYVSVVTGGSFTQAGTSVLTGRVAAKGDITFRGGVALDSGLPVFGGDPISSGSLKIAVLSRR